MVIVGGAVVIAVVILALIAIDLRWFCTTFAIDALGLLDGATLVRRLTLIHLFLCLLLTCFHLLTLLLLFGLALLGDARGIFALDLHFLLTMTFGPLLLDGALLENAFLRLAIAHGFAFLLALLFHAYFAITLLSGALAFATLAFHGLAIFCGAHLRLAALLLTRINACRAFAARDHLLLRRGAVAGRWHHAWIAATAIRRCLIARLRFFASRVTIHWKQFARCARITDGRSRTRVLIAALPAQHTHVLVRIQFAIRSRSGGRLRDRKSVV